MNEEDGKGGNLKLRLELPVLTITAKRDIVSAAKIMKARIWQFADNVRVKELNTGHWVQLEVKDEVNSYLEQFFSNLEVTVE